MVTNCKSCPALKSYWVFEKPSILSVKQYFNCILWLQLHSYFMYIFFYSVKCNESGVKALVTLANGDMRKVLNILQSTSMAFDEVTEDNVYTCVGHPLRRDIENIVNWVLNENFTTAYNSILFISFYFYLHWDSFCFILLVVLLFLYSDTIFILHFFVRHNEFENSERVSIKWYIDWSSHLCTQK